MHAVSYDHFGAVDVLELRELPSPQPGPGQVLVDVVAASLNPVDGKIRRGELKFLSGRKFPKRVGGDFAGVVRELGPGVDGLRVGDEVFGLVDGMAGGAHAEQVVTRASKLVRKPAGLSFEEAAAAPVVGLAALLGLRDVGEVRPGARVLINGASGGVGTMAVQIAKLLGAEVVATASREGVELVRELGADRAYDYRQTDLSTLGERFDVIFELSGRLPFAAARALLAPSGVYIDPAPTPKVIVGSALANLLRRQKLRVLLAQPGPAELRWLAERLGAGELRVVVDRSFALPEFREATRYVETRSVRGKVVLRMREAAGARLLRAG